MQYREAIGDWRIDANGYVGRLQLWMAGAAAAGRLWLDAHQVWETLTAVSFNGTQRYTGKLAFDTLAVSSWTAAATIPGTQSGPGRPRRAKKATWQPLAPMVTPGSPQVLRLPY